MTRNAKLAKIDGSKAFDNLRKENYMVTLKFNRKNDSTYVYQKIVVLTNNK